MQPSLDFEEKIVSAIKTFVSSMNSGGVLAADISSLADATSQIPLSNFDYWERLIRHEYSKALNSSPQYSWKIWRKSSEHLTWLDLVSGDGYKRQETLRAKLGAPPNAFFFVLIIRRLNDWVPQVREAARDWLSEIAQEANPKHVADAVCATLSNWNTWGRIEDTDKQVLLGIISRKVISESLRSKLVSSASGPMTTVLAQIGRTSALDDYLGEIAEMAIQPSLRAKAYRSQFEGRMVWIEGQRWEWTDVRYCIGRFKPIVFERKLNLEIPLMVLLQSSAYDRSSIVRRVSAEFLIRNIEKLGDKSIPFARHFASDKSSSVSERGEFALKRLEGIG